jgi:predicted small lipoprotein YifL
MRIAFLLALSAALAAAGCGQKGPLYLRESPPPGVKPKKPEPYQPVPYPKRPASEHDASGQR